MPRKGRDLELLVAHLEKHLGNTGIQVKSPDYIVGWRSKSRREIDVALRAKIGSSDVLVIVECRDRDDTEDVRWPAELDGKRDDVHADKAVAVSSEGFTSGAKNMAASYGILLRTMQEVDLSEVLLWFPFKEMTFDGLGLTMHHVDILLDSKALGSALPSVAEIDRVPFRAKHNGTYAPLLQHLWNDIPGPRLYEHVPPTGTRIRHILPISFPNEQSRYQLDSSAGLIDVIEITMVADLWIERKQVPLALVQAYMDGDRTLAREAQFKVDHEYARLVVSLAEYPDQGTQSIAAWGAGVPNVATYLDVDVSNPQTNTNRVVRLVMGGH